MCSGTLQTPPIDVFIQLGPAPIRPWTVSRGYKVLFVFRVWIISCMWIEAATQYYVTVCNIIVRLSISQVIDITGAWHQGWVGLSKILYGGPKHVLGTSKNCWSSLIWIVGSKCVFFCSWSWKNSICDLGAPYHSRGCGPNYAGEIMTLPNPLIGRRAVVILTC